jgi:tetratricopeptide (TPR) repeat protein
MMPGIAILMSLLLTLLPTFSGSRAEQIRNNLARAKVFLAAGDYRRAIEMCQKEVEEAPSAESYVYLTYVYQALNGYLDHLAKTEQWVKIEQLFVNLAFRDLDALTDPPDMLVRMAKELIAESAGRQADVAAAMAMRLDQGRATRLWQQQAAWRAARPETWWMGPPPEWGW